jgi:hypothetical protein
MSELALNIFDPKEIVRLKAVLNEVVLSLPKQQHAVVRCKLPSQSSFLNSPRTVRRIR